MIDDFEYNNGTWAVCGRLGDSGGYRYRPGEDPRAWDRGLLIRFGGVGRLVLRSIPAREGQGHLGPDNKIIDPVESAHARAFLAAAAPCMYRLLRDIKEDPGKDWLPEIRNVLQRAETGKGYYYRSFYHGTQG